jgi:hypothetical protein
LHDRGIQPQIGALAANRAVAQGLAQDVQRHVQDVPCLMHPLLRPQKRHDFLARERVLPRCREQSQQCEPVPLGWFPRHPPIGALQAGSTEQKKLKNGHA